jgi:hypothetical protein
MPESVDRLPELPGSVGECLKGMAPIFQAQAWSNLQEKGKRDVLFV